MSNYDYSIPLDTNLAAYDNRFHHATEYFARALRDTKYFKRWANRYSEHLNLILLNLYCNYTTDPLLYTSYSRDTNFYTKNKRYHSIDLKYDSTIKVIDGLIALGLAEGKKGFYNRSKQGHASRIARVRGTKTLYNLLTDMFAFSEEYLSRAENEEIIILKDKDKILIDYNAEEEPPGIRDNLIAINQKISEHFIGLHLPDDVIKQMCAEVTKKAIEDVDGYRPPIHFTNIKLKRPFNNGVFTEGGRFYGGWWESVPSRYRPYIRIDDETTIEIDFSGYHINLLYAIEGLPIPKDDVYTLKDMPSCARNFIKVALQIILNSKYKHRALFTIKKECPKEMFSELLNDYSYEEIVQRFKDKHSKISKYFYSGYGVKLQFIDSQIAERIMLSLASQDIVALPIHDSFIVSKKHEQELFDAMNKAVIELYGQSIKAKPDKTAYEIDRDLLIEKVGLEDAPHTEEEYLENWTRECTGYEERKRTWRRIRGLD